MEYKPKVISSIRLIEDIIPVSKEEVELESGRHINYTVFEYHNAAAVVALTSDNKVLLVRVPRYPIKQYLWELPGGKVDKDELRRDEKLWEESRHKSPEEKIDAAFEQCAARELEEETGYKPGRPIERLITYYPEPSFSTERLDIFLATELVKTGKAIPEKDGFCEVKLFDFQDSINMIFDGQIKSSWSIIGLLAAQLRFIGKWT
jgi:ADP-ribose pyrophosphatase